MKFFYSLITSVIVSMFFFSTVSATDLSGTLTSDITLSLAGSPYDVVGDYIIPDGFTLTIEPGVEIDINSYSYDIIVQGSLSAIGTVTDSIVFASTATNGGGSLVLESSANSHTLEYCSFDRLGTFSLSLYDTGLYLEDTDLTMDHSTFTNCGPSGILPIKANASVLDNFGPNNSIEIIEFFSGSLDRTCTWPKADPNGMTYRILGNQVNPLGESLTIEPGVTIDFRNYSADLVIFGELFAIGTVSDSILFTSYWSNGGGSLSLKAGSTSDISHARFEELGRFSLSSLDTGIFLEEASLTMDDCSFSNCGPNGAIHMIADANSIGGIGPNNVIERLQFIDNSLDANAVWPNIDASGFTYEIQNDQTLAAGDSLTIMSGVVIELLKYNSDLHIDGTLDVMGTSANPVRLYAQGTNGGGSLALRDGSAATLNHMIVDSLGHFSLSAYDTGIYIADAEVTANNISMDYCGPNGARDMDANPDALSGFGPDNSIKNVLLSNVDVAQDATWPLLDPTGVTYTMDSDINVISGSTLTLEPGIVIDLNIRSADLFINGTLKSIGSAQDSIYFKSSASNGGGSVVFRPTSVQNEVEYTSFNKLGNFSLSAFDSSIYSETDELSVEKSTIRNSRYGIYVITGQPIIHGNVIKDNTILGMFNANSNLLVDACDNYWGDPSGPYNVSSNPAGLGNGISDNITAGACFASSLEIICPDDVTVVIGDDYSISAIGNVEICIQDCPSLASSVFSDSDPDPQCTEAMTRTFTVSDTCGEVRVCAQTVNFIDETLPTIVCPPNQNLNCNESLPEVDLNEVVGMDNCAVASIILANENEEIDGCIHTYSRRFRVTDTSGNTARCTQVFVVKEDLNPPVLIGVPADITVECVAPAIATVTATDDCDAVTPSFTETGVGGCGATIVRTWMAVDACGNSVSASQTITFNDTTAPVLDPAPADIEIYCSDIVPGMATLTATDNCGLATVTPSEDVTGTCPAVITRTWVATDECGNSAIETQVITIVPEPVCYVPTDLDVIELGFGTSNARVNATWTNDNSTTDCEVRGGRIAPSSIGTGTPVFANINNTQVISQTDGSTVLFNIVLYNNPNVPFNVGQTYGYEARCLCEDELGYSDWSGMTDESTFIVPAPPAGIGSSSLDEAKLSLETSLTIFPNPSNGEEISLSVSGEELEDATIQVMDMNGKVILESRLDQETKKGLMNLSFDSKLNGGVYLVQLFNENQLINQRFIVE